ncbi:hypothetical protein CIPAW_09G224600 [Carya illinoinensis]|uniref:Uncharacterized protein n=1 Tax=Carya illinoinensis TaxID=32201 RepID=A0A8T1PRL0_CARIL|nr:hypothetical protein CIPAW_09G224600 [Carya illinoinensis]
MFWRHSLPKRSNSISSLLAYLSKKYGISSCLLPEG